MRPRPAAIGRRHLVAVAVVLLLALLGFGALTRLLQEVHFRDIQSAFAAIGARRFALGIVLTAVSYFALTFYDRLALSAIGQPLPWRIAALASFTSYTIGNNLGMALVTGSSARYRVYSAEGFSAGDVARVVALAGLAFWGGLLFLCGILLGSGAGQVTLGGLAPPPLVQRAAGMTLLLVLAMVLGWAGRRGRTLHLWRWHLTVPGYRLALLQIAVAVVDLAAASAVLLVLVPGATAALWPEFFVSYVLAVLAGLLSAVPGGVGVFEAVILATMPSVGRPELMAALLGYRLVYYLLPLLVAGVLVVLREGQRWRQPAAAALRGGQRIASALAPTMAAALTFLGGVLLLFSGSLPALPGRMRRLYELLPLPFIEVSHMAASMVGMALLLLSSGLYRRLDGASYLARLLLLAGGAFSILKGLDYEEAATMLLIAALLQWTRKSFYRQTRLTQQRLSGGWLLLVALTAGLAVWLGLFAFKNVAYRNDLWWHFSVHGDASRFLRASVAVAVLLVALGIWRLLQPAPPPAAQDDATPPPAALGLAERSSVNLAHTGDKRFLAAPGGRAFLMYQLRGRSWIVMGNPVGDRSEWRELLWSIRERADRAQGRLMLYQITVDVVPIAIDLGLQVVKYGEEARIDLDGFRLDGPAAKSLRAALRRAERDGASFEVIGAAALPAVLERLREISAGWLATRGGREKGFSVGRFDPDYLGRFDCAVVRAGGRIVAFANLWQTANRCELSIDLMRHDAAAPPGTMDYLFVELMRWGKARGYRWFTLGVAPLSGLEARRLAPVWSRLGSLFYRHGAAFYGFDGLRRYKDKFSPQWEPCFIAGPPGLAFGRALFDLQALIAAPPRPAGDRSGG